MMAMADRRKDVDRFGRWASTYDRSYLQRLIFEPVHQATLEAVNQALPSPGRLLDVGCGTGQLLRRAAASFPDAHLVGVDPAGEMVQRARTSAVGVGASFVQGAAEALPFDDANFDLVVSSMSFHHWADQQEGLREVSRVLVPGGLLALADALALGWMLRVGLRIAGKRRRFHTPDELDAIFAKQGLSTIDRRALPRMGGSVQVILARTDKGSG
jgi:ubiquinone/menaquinone biosynthesis C-methylase UbiE